MAVSGMLAGLAMYCGREHDMFTLRARCVGEVGVVRVSWASEEGYSLSFRDYSGTERYKDEE